MPEALSTAVTENDGYERISDCSMCEPSVEAKYLCSFTNCMNADTKLAPGTFSASSWICSSRSSFGCSGISKGFFLTGVFQTVSYACDRREPHRLLVDLPVRLRDAGGLRRDARDLVLR